ncbi:hypothetical protein ACFLZ2_06225, partial [Candidatus Margulisiibacteriota bacterium]
MSIGALSSMNNDPRSVGMGNATVASASGAESITHNPAALNKGEKKLGTNVYYAESESWIGATNASLTSEIFGLQAGIQVAFLSAGEMEETDSNGDTIGTLQLNNYSTSLSFAFDPVKTLSVGLTGSLIVEDTTYYREFDHSYTLGALWQMTGNLKAGVVIQNFIPPANDDPISPRIGLSYTPFKSVLLAYEVEFPFSLNGTSAVHKFGTELSGFSD